MDKVPGCWEHMSMVWSALKEACSTRSSLANILLDIANAYGSIPHGLLFFALEHYGIDPHCISLIKMYYSTDVIQAFIVILFLSLPQVPIDAGYLLFVRLSFFSVIAIFVTFFSVIFRDIEILGRCPVGSVLPHDEKVPP